MAEIYLSPDDFNADIALEVLSFLNRAQSAQEIADRIEIPGELDIGVRLGQRLLNRRAELGGSFENLGQIYAVPLIGPERFTEIVTELSGKSALEILATSVHRENSAQTVHLGQQIQALRELLAQTEEFSGRRYRIELQARQDMPYLGEVVDLKVRVVDRFSHAAGANMGLTIETNWGRLRHARGYNIQSGTVLRAKTGIDGVVRFQLYTPTCEPLTEHQQNALSNGLHKLSHGGEQPNDIREDLASLVELYQHPLNRDLRAAVDIHYTTRRTTAVDTLNHAAALYSWQHEQALVRVYLYSGEEREQSTVLAMAALPLEYRDWLPPWYQVYKRGLNQSNELNTGLREAVERSDNERGLAELMLADMHGFIARQNGLIGERAAQQVSEEVVTRLFTDELSALSPDAQTTIRTLLKEAPASLRGGSSGQIGVATQMARDVGRSEGLFETVAGMKDLSLQLGAMQSDISGMTTRMQAVESATEGIDFAQLQQDVTTFQADYGRFKQNYDDFLEKYQHNDARINDFGAELDARSKEFDRQLERFDTQRESFDKDLAAFRKGVETFNATKDQLVANVTDGVNAAFKEIEASSTTRVTIKPIDNIVLRTSVQPPGR